MTKQQHFNMTGYVAPKLDVVRVGIIGVGNRGIGPVERLKHIEGVQILAMGDLRRDRLESARERLDPAAHPVELYSDGPEDWKRLCDRTDLDVIYICTPWDLHTPMAVYAMEQGKHALVEVPAATTVEECWQLVETSERTRRYCMMVENCCYDFFELLTLNMAQQGYFGEIVHCEGAYIHCLMPDLFNRHSTHRNWRFKENARRNGNLYPTHGLGPICQVMNVNRGDQFDYMVSISSNDFTMGAHAEHLATQGELTDENGQALVGRPYRGNMNTSIIRTKRGRTIMLQHDVSSPRVYSRIHLVSGTKGAALKYPEPGRISTGHEAWLTPEAFAEVEAKYTPAMVRKMGEIAKDVGGHGGMDFLMDWRTFTCLRQGRPLDQDVYDAALWSVIGPLSEQSVANRAGAIDIPDFTRGAWKSNKPVDLSIE